MNSFSIAQLAQLSGIKPHTIRIWEQRYHALAPARSEGNTRSYNDLDLRRLLNIVTLVDSGFKVSELCILPDENLHSLISTLYTDELKDYPQQFISQLISAGMEFNELAFRKTLSHCFLQYGVEQTYKSVIYPLLTRVGLMWAVDAMPPANEHFMSNLIRQKLLAAIDDLPPAKKTEKSWLLFLPENEFHEIGLLFAQYILRKKSHNVYYLGANVPLKAVKQVIQKVNPSNMLLFFIVNTLPAEKHEYLSELMDGFNGENICITGNGKIISQIEIAGKVKWLKELADFEKIL